MRFSPLAGVLALLLFAGCAQDPAPPLPTLPPPPAPLPQPDPVPAPDAVPIGFGGVLPRSGTPLVLHPGNEFVLAVMVEDELPYEYQGSNWAGVQVAVRTDAPPDVVSVPEQVIANDWREPGGLTIRALGFGSPAASGGIYSIRLQPPPGGFPDVGGFTFRLAAEPIRVRIAGAAAVEEPDCAGLSLRTRGPARRGSGGAVGENWFGDLGREYRGAEVTLMSPGTNTELRLLEAYQQLPYGELAAAYNLVPVMFARELGLDPRAAGFEQTLSLAWFDDLALRASIPGCAPVELYCNERGQCRSR